MDIFAKLAEKIIQEQEMIIGPIALERVKDIPGLTVNWDKREVALQGNKTQILEKLVESYKSLFGQTSVEVCREAAAPLINQLPSDQLPQILR